MWWNIVSRRANGAAFTFITSRTATLILCSNEFESHFNPTEMFLTCLTGSKHLSVHEKLIVLNVSNRKCSDCNTESHVAISASTASGDSWPTNLAVISSTKQLMVQPIKKHKNCEKWQSQILEAKVNKQKACFGRPTVQKSIIIFQICQK